MYSSNYFKRFLPKGTFLANPIDSRSVSGLHDIVRSLLFSLLLFFFFLPSNHWRCIRWMRDLCRESAGLTSGKFIPLKLEEVMNRVLVTSISYISIISPPVFDTDSHWIMRPRLCKSTAINFWRRVLAMSGQPIVICAWLTLYYKVVRSSGFFDAFFVLLIFFFFFFSNISAHIVDFDSYL